MTEVRGDVDELIREVFCADFKEKFESPYTFSVAVDIAAGVIFPVDDLPETQRHAW